LNKTLFRAIRYFVYRPPFDVFLIKFLVLLMWMKRTTTLRYNTFACDYLSYLVCLVSDFTVHERNPPEFRDTDPISGISFPIRHFSRIQYKTTDYGSAETPDFMLPVIDHKHGFILRILLESTKEELKTNLQIVLRLTSHWRDRYKVNDGLPYLLSLTISQRLIHWSVAVAHLSNMEIEDDESCLLKDKLIEWFLENSKLELLALIARSTVLDKVQNNFLVAECVAVVSACYMIGQNIYFAFITNYLSKVWHGFLNIFISKLNEGQTNEGSSQYTKYILETCTLLAISDTNFEWERILPLVRFTESYMWSDGTLARCGDDSFEQFLDILPRSGQHILFLRSYLNRFVSQSWSMFKKGLSISRDHTTYLGNHMEIFLDHEVLDSSINYGGHSHLDFSSFQARLDGELVVVDPGTFTYHDTSKRDAYRGMQKHNVIVWSSCYELKFTRRFGFNQDMSFSSQTLFDQESRPYGLRMFSNIQGVEALRTVEFDQVNECIIIHDRCSEASCTSLIHLHPSTAVFIDHEVSQVICRLSGGKRCLVIEYLGCIVDLSDYMFSPVYGQEVIASRLDFTSIGNKLSYKIYAR